MKDQNNSKDAKSVYADYGAKMQAFFKDELSKEDWFHYCEETLHNLIKDHADVFKRLKVRW